MITPFRRHRYPRDFWDRVDSSGGPEACWPWIGPTVQGYGRLNVGSDQWRAHRYAFTLANGSIKPGAVLMHSCDNPRCCNPAHLREGTKKENSVDASVKGRLGAMKLTRAQRDEIRARRASGERAWRLAEEFGVTEGNVHGLARRAGGNTK